MALLRGLIRWTIRLAHWVFFPLLVLACLLCRLIPKKFDVGMGPQPLINNVYWAQALRLKGYRVETFVDETYRITNSFDVNFTQGLRRLYYYIPALSFLRAVARYRCMYVYFDGGPLRHIPGLRLLEPQLMHLAGLKTVVMPYGSDSQIFERTPNTHLIHVLCQDYPVHFQKSHGKVTRQVEVWSRGADIVIGAMDSVDYLFFWNRIRHCHFAFDTGAITPRYPQGPDGRTYKILHAPNHTNVKGSQFIIQAVETLQTEGYPVELVFIQGKTNQEVLQLMQEADIVVDQLIMGTYAMFAIEAMSNGKPVVGYLREDHIRLYEVLGCIEKGEAPLIQADVVTITDVLRNLLDHPEDLAAHGQRARKFAEKYHSLESVGSFFDEINRDMGILPG